MAVGGGDDDAVGRPHRQRHHVGEPERDERGQAEDALEVGLGRLGAGAASAVLTRTASGPRARCPARTRTRSSTARARRPCAPSRCARGPYMTRRCARLERERRAVVPAAEPAERERQAERRWRRQQRLHARGVLRRLGRVGLRVPAERAAGARRARGRRRTTPAGRPRPRAGRRASSRRASACCREDQRGERELRAVGDRHVPARVGDEAGGHDVGRIEQRVAQLARRRQSRAQPVDAGEQVARPCRSR